MFPIGNLLKSEVRAIAAREKLPSAQRKDSQGICFLGKVNYNEFIERYLGRKEGLIVELETGNILGKHQGFWFHTIGQRKGLGLSGGPWFVIKKDIQRNIVYVSKGYDTKHQYGEVINLQGFEFISKDVWGDFEDEKEITFKIRRYVSYPFLRTGTGYCCRPVRGNIRQREKNLPWKRDDMLKKWESGKVERIIYVVIVNKNDY